MVARPRVNGPVAIVLTRWPALDVGGGCGREMAWPCAGTGGVSAQERHGEDSFCCPSWGPPDTLLGAPVRGTSTST